MEIILTILPYLGIAVATLAGNFLITKVARKKQVAEAEKEEEAVDMARWETLEKQLKYYSEKLNEANTANDNIMRKWQELSKLHEDSVKDSAEKAISIAKKDVQIATLQTEKDDAVIKATKYKAENAKLLKALEEVPRMKLRMESMSLRIKELENKLSSGEDKLCEMGECKARKK